MQMFMNLWYCFHIQIFWNYHTMIGVGACFLLDKLYGDEELPADIRYRLVQFFNGHPYVAPYGVAAIATELHKNYDETKISRFIQGVVGILGAVGDHYYWNGFKPLILLVVTGIVFLKLPLFFIVIFSIVLFILYNIYQCRERIRGIEKGKALGFGVVKEIKAIKNRWGYTNFPRIVFYVILVLTLTQLIPIILNYKLVILAFVGLGLGAVSGKKGSSVYYFVGTLSVYICIELVIKQI